MFTISSIRAYIFFFKSNKYFEGSFSFCQIFFLLENRFPPQLPFKGLQEWPIDPFREST